MIRKKLLSSSFIIPIFSVFFYFLLSATTAFAANFPLEITNIKPAGTGNPAIPSTNRIFRAYPGIEYNIRAAVIGGLYPYTYNLNNAPSGMTINRATGEISWPNPQADADSITLSVTDTENTAITTTWSINVTTTGFIFINSSYSGTEIGSISQPYVTLVNMLSNETTTTDIVYFMAGTYQMVRHNAVHKHAMNLSASPTNWIAYPDDIVTLQGGGNTGKAYRVTIQGTPFYLDGLILKDMIDYGIFTQSFLSYKTIRRCTFDGLVPSDSINNNYGFIHTTSGGPGYYSLIQDCEFKNWRNSSAIGSLYDDDKLLIENNYIHSPLPDDVPSGIGTSSGISPKLYSDQLTIRGNKVIMNVGNLMGGINAAFYNGNKTEICFNLFVKTSERGGHIFDWSPGHQKDTYYWRNTLIGDLVIRSGDGGPYFIHNNVISNPNTGYEFLMTDFISHTVSTNLPVITTIADNLTSTDANSLVNSNDHYKLVSGQSAYIGTRGWQLADGSVPMEGVYTPSPSIPLDFQHDLSAN